MTVAISVISADGIVIAADSRTTVQFKEDVPKRVLSDFTHKVFQVGEIALATYGWAFLNGRNIAGHLSQFLAGDVPEEPKAVAESLASFLKNRIEEHIAKHPKDALPPGQDALGFLIGGYEDDVGRVYELSLPSGEILEIGNTLDKTGAAWRGQTDVIRRLIKGVDLDVLTYFAQQEGKVNEVSGLKTLLDKLEYVIPFEAMNLQDAIDFATFCIRTTIDAQRLTHGYLGEVGSWPGVGGPIEIAAVSRARFRWVQQTTLQGERPAGLAEI